MKPRLLYRTTKKGEGEEGSDHFRPTDRGGGGSHFVPSFFLLGGLELKWVRKDGETYSSALFSEPWGFIQ